MTIYFNINNSPQGTNVSYLTLTSRFEVLQISFYFLTFEKADCSIFTLSVGWLVDVTINFFNMQFSAFFLFSNFRKGRLLYIRPVGWLVGRSVGWWVDVTINFFNIYRHKSPLLTQYHSIPISTKLY